MSKLSFRARALDASKPMPVYMAEELPDLPEYSAINRAVPQMPSGMEKEEECEHHLQRAIVAGLIIPTPEVADCIDEDYDRLYPANYKQPRQLIHMQPFAMEQDIPDYDMDSDDERWLVSQAKKLDITPLKFEEMMDRLEKSSGQTVVSLNEAKALLKEDDDLIIAVFDYWLNKRLKTQHPLILSVKTEHRIGSAINNPYLAFRRRTEKMQTRKNRKNDEASYEKMLKLRRDLSRAVTLLELVKRREKTKRELIHLTIEIYEKRYQARDFSGSMLAEVSALKSSRPAFTQLFQNHYANPNWTSKAAIKDDIVPRKEKRQYKKKKHKSSSHSRLAAISGVGMDGLQSSDEDETAPSQASPEPEDSEDEGPFTFRRNKLCSYHMPITNGFGNWPWCSREENGLAERKYRFTLTSLRNPPQCIGFARRRVGRGGRVILDRVSTNFDDFWRNLDFTVIETESQISATIKEKYCDSENCFNSEAYLRNRINDGASTSGFVASEVVSGSSSEIKAEAKSDADNRTECNSSQEVCDQNDMLQFLSEVKRDWLHFRPKTPPSPLSEVPDDYPSLHLTQPITIELQNLSACATTLLDDSLFTTAPFTLRELDAADVFADFDDTRQRESERVGAVCGRTFGCSRFRVNDYKSASDNVSGPCASKPSILSSTLTSPKYNSVNVFATLDAPRPKHVNIVNHVNGPLSYSELSSGRKGNKMQHNAYITSTTFGGRGSSSNSSNVISTLNSSERHHYQHHHVRPIPLPHNTVTALHNTLNSHSLIDNILDVNSHGGIDATSVCGDASALPVAPSAAGDAKQTLVRKNNSLPMEVT